MFGLTIEKIIVIGVVAAIIIGPQRLPLYAEKLATFIRNFRNFTDSTRRRAEEELGVPVAAMDPKTWNTQFRAYDPRRIVRDALNSDGTASAGAAPDAAVPDAASDVAASSPETGREPEQEPVQEYRERWVVVGGSSGHPIRRRIVEPVPPVVDVQDAQDVQDETQDAPAAAAAPEPAAAAPAPEPAAP
ncbi:Sec-independent protein translocase subunit TatA/TatB [Corynebacterium sp. AOP40-9SA-29]|uniref:Sec-independent protein translocase subunit TatA/TatB n=1 Tax=Corynebacterium sp. AOP40-9SA-29 TaxID=3457677 RepID=UPI004034A30D